MSKSLDSNSHLPNQVELKSSGLEEMDDVRFQSMDDNAIAVWLSSEFFTGKLAYNLAFGWLVYNGKHWVLSGKHEVIELVRQIHSETVARAFGERELSLEKLKSLQALLNQPKMVKVVELLKGLHHVDPERFDANPELFNAGNGVINLRSGELLPHSPDYFMIRHCKTNYTPDATHEDWAKALSALPSDEHWWIQRRFGQGITGYPTSDDVLPILGGYGENGKSTIVVGVSFAVGDYATAISERLLLANASDHPTELMSLRGVRLGIIEELPEDKRLPVKRLKDVLGVEKLKARLVHKDNVEWEVTHSLVVTTNYLPEVVEVDRATWRRLALVNFPYTFVNTDRPLSMHERRGDPGLRQRLKKGKESQHEAVLAWLVKGAILHLANEDELRNVPPRIATDTLEWRHSVDHLLHFLSENFEFDSNSHVRSSELHQCFDDWAFANDKQRLSMTTLVGRLQRHEEIQKNGVIKERISPRKGLSTRHMSSSPTGQYTAWIGLKFKS